MIVAAINASPRTGHNTASLVREAANGARKLGAEVRYFDLYRQDRFTGCVSCFGCKLVPNEGRCICRDGLTPILDAIRDSDAIILGTPNYLGQPSAGFRALYERIVFQNLTYQKERPRYRPAETPVLFIMISNMQAERYEQEPLAGMIRSCQQGLSENIGPTEVFICGHTLQVRDYSRFHWTAFDAEAKKAAYEQYFPEDLRRVRDLTSTLIHSLQ